MKVLFAGPSLYGLGPDLSGISLCGPAAHGDVARAVFEGATAIGLVDGKFEAVAAVWHKDILFALANGVAILGASSMGALRAAECASFGMVPVGAIAQAYLSGALDDDAAVALLHGPKELGYPPFTEPLVNVQPTLWKLHELGLISDAEREELWLEACRLHFKDRTVDAIFDGAGSRRKALAYEEHRVNRKGEDALLLITELRKAVEAPPSGADAPSPNSFFSREVLPALVANSSRRVKAGD
jgi:hypothetical protein